MSKNVVLPRMYSLLAVGCLAFATNVVAQTPSYEIQWVETPQPASSQTLWCMNDNGLGGGHWVDEADGSQHALIYDSNSATSFKLRDLLTSPNPAQLSSNEVTVLDLNDQGQGVANIRGTGIAFRIGIWFDLVSGEWDYVPTPRSVQSFPDADYYGRHINNFGDILVPFKNANGEWEAYIYNPFDETGGANLEYLELGFPLYYTTLNLNDMRQVIGSIDNQADDPAFRWTSSSQIEILDPLFSGVSCLNNWGEICGSAAIPGGRKGRTEWTSFRYRDEGDFELLPTQTKFAWGNNDAGDIVGVLDDDRPYIYYNGQVIQLDDLVVGDSADVSVFRNSDVNFGYVNGCITNRESGTGLGRIFGFVTTTVGKGKNRTTVTRAFVLIPRT